MKVVVFDLDETLGYFSEFGMFLDFVQELRGGHPVTQTEFNELLDLFPEFVRPNLWPILRYLYRQKRSSCCDKLFIYTNNQGPREWAQRIVAYFHRGVPGLFDQIVAAFKVHGRRVELGRTTSNKTHGDLLRCTRLPADAEICFFDDMYHPAMANEHIVYVHIKPYTHDLPADEMAKRFQRSGLMALPELTPASLTTHMAKYHYDLHPKSREETEVDKVVGKQMLHHLKEFFRDKPLSGTRRHRPTFNHHNTRRRFP